MKYRQAPHVVARRLGQELLLVPVKGNLADMRQVFTLNATGEAIWQSLALPVTLDQVVERLCAAFHVPESTARLDAAECLADLSARGLVETGSA
ncbi:MAG: PqqD family protein [Kiritimatiellae bacterium]|nr:PqqD family protein [Kiritimatiellia bacterium]